MWLKISIDVLKKDIQSNDGIYKWNPIQNNIFKLSYSLKLNYFNNFLIF